MTLKPIAALGAAAALIATAALAQSPNPIIATVVADLEAAGYAHIEVEQEDGQFEVEAYGEAGEIERYYSLEGLLLREEITVDGVEVERVFDAAGNVISEEIETDDDDNDGDDD